MEPFDFDDEELEKFFKKMQKSLMEMTKGLMETSDFPFEVKKFDVGLFGKPKQVEMGFREPFIDFNETQKELIITVELPGVTKLEDVNFKLSETEFDLKAKRTENQKVADKRGEVMQSSFMSFQNSVSLPVKVKPKTRKAAFNNGVLEIKVEKA